MEFLACSATGKGGQLTLTLPVACWQLIFNRPGQGDVMSPQKAQGMGHSAAATNMELI